MRKQNWAIQIDEDGIHSVTRGNRPVATGLTSRQSAEDIVRRSRQPGEPVHLVEADGYRTNLTRHFPDPAPEPGTEREPVDIPGRPAWSRYLNRYGRQRG